MVRNIVELGQWIGVWGQTRTVASDWWLTRSRFARAATRSASAGNWPQRFGKRVSPGLHALHTREMYVYQVFEERNEPREQQF